MARVQRSYKKVLSNQRAAFGPSTLRFSHVREVLWIDVHRDTLVATLLDGQTDEKQTRKFQNNPEETAQLKDWLMFRTSWVFIPYSVVHNKGVNQLALWLNTMAGNSASI
jgi:hypothetical protein